MGRRLVRHARTAVQGSGDGQPAQAVLDGLPKYVSAVLLEALVRTPLKDLSASPSRTCFGNKWARGGHLNN
jgi:hypothetical protein